MVVVMKLRIPGPHPQRMRNAFPRGWRRVRPPAGRCPFVVGGSPAQASL